MKVLRRLVRILLVLVTVVVLAALVTIGWLGSGRLVSPDRRLLQDYHRERLERPADFGLRLTSYTGPGRTPCLLVEPAPGGRSDRSRALRGRLGHAPPWGEIRGTVVMLHGHGGRKEDHLPICERFCAAGFRSIVPDLPGHGDHPYPLATFGKRECAWVEALVDDAIDRHGLPDQPVFLFGISQGGAIALQTAARAPDRWAGVISISSFAALDRTIERSAANFDPRSRQLAGLGSFAVGCGSWCRAGYIPGEIRPAEAARKLTMPVMVVHGCDDRFIPISDAEEIVANIPTGTKRLRPVPGGGHGDVLAADAGRLYPEMCRFLIDAASGQ
jgi:pimeloyl-ACP methyl ester carboxylesterase